MAKVKTATRDTGSSVSGTLTLYHAEETYSGRPPVYALGVTAGVQSCGLAVAYWDNDAGVYKYDLSSLGVGGSWELTGESYEEGKRIFIAWIGQAVWAGEDPETKYQNAGVVATALTRLYAGVDATPWTVSVNWSIAVTSSHLWRERTATASTGRDSAPVYAHETTVTDTWIADRPASASVQCGGATLTTAQTWNSAARLESNSASAVVLWRMILEGLRDQSALRGFDTHAP